MEHLKERRSYYRIDDAVGLKYHLLQPGQDVESVSDTVEAAVATELKQIDKEFNRLVNVLWKQSPSAANALGLLNRKLTVVVDAALGHSAEGEGGEFVETPVNISGAGISFAVSEYFEPGSRVGLALQLRPSNTQLSITALVKYCHAEESVEDGSPTGRYVLRAEFESGNEAAQERLIQHIVQRQCAVLEEENKNEVRVAQ